MRLAIFMLFLLSTQLTAQGENMYAGGSLNFTFQDAALQRGSGQSFLSESTRSQITFTPYLLLPRGRRWTLGISGVLGVGLGLGMGYSITARLGFVTNWGGLGDQFSIFNTEADEDVYQLHQLNLNFNPSAFRLGMEYQL